VERVEVLDGGLLRISTDPRQAAEVNRRLVSSGVMVSELRVAEQSLEKVFLDLTGGEASSE